MPDPALDRALEPVANAIGQVLGPALARDVLPVILRDRELVRFIALEIGKGVGQELRLPAQLTAAAVVALVVWLIARDLGGGGKSRRASLRTATTRE